MLEGEFQHLLNCHSMPFSCPFLQAWCPRPSRSHLFCDTENITAMDLCVGQNRGKLSALPWDHYESFTANAASGSPVWNCLWGHKSISENDTLFLETYMKIKYGDFFFVSNLSIIGHINCSKYSSTQTYRQTCVADSLKDSETWEKLTTTQRHRQNCRQKHSSCAHI